MSATSDDALPLGLEDSQRSKTQGPLRATSPEQPLFDLFRVFLWAFIWQQRISWRGSRENIFRRKDILKNDNYCKILKFDRCAQHFPSPSGNFAQFLGPLNTTDKLQFLARGKGLTQRSVEAQNDTCVGAASDSAISVPEFLFSP